MKKRKIIKKLESPLSDGYKYYGKHFQKYIDSCKEGLTELTATRFLQTYCTKRKVGLSSKSNCKKAIIHIVKLTLIREKKLELETYFRQALGLIKINLQPKAVKPTDVPTPRDLRMAKDNADIRLACIIDFINTTCLRIKEVLSTKLSYCRYDNLSTGYIIEFTRKGGNKHKTWIPKELYDRIVIEFNSKIYLFQSPFHTDRHIAVGTVQRWFRNVSRFTEKPLRAHLIRHKATNEIVKENPNIPLYTLCENFGHSESTFVKHYLIKENSDVTNINKKHFIESRNKEKESI